MTDSLRPIAMRPTMRKLPALFAVAAVAGGVLLSGCGNAPGSVAGDPLAGTLIQAETKLQAWAATQMSITFTGSGQLGSANLPCMTLLSSTRPQETFSMDYIKDNASTGGCSGDDTDTVTLHYANNQIYVTDAGRPPATSAGSKSDSCQHPITSHAVSGDLAEKFVGQQTGQAKMADMMKAATEISGDNHQITVQVDAAAMAKVGGTKIPSGADLDDVDVTAVALLDAEGALSSLTLTMGMGDVGSLKIASSYQQSTEKPELPDPACVRKGEPFSSESQLQSVLS